ncbi:MAG: MoxR family ATPase [Phycisphaerae bacterium]|nr:MoxR family ATPase [Phycisphaerae bacterium]
MSDHVAIPNNRQHPLSDAEAEQGAEEFRQTFETLRNEVSRFMVGQEAIIEQVLMAVVCGGHVLLEGVPGLGKTALVHTIAQAVELDFRRIQFTPDLLPADILGTNLLIEDDSGHKRFRFQPGPVFTNVLLADEINRATPKTQSALLETMQEKTVSVAHTTHELSRPFFVLATQNPIEMDGTYPLPEAQLDRFFFKLKVDMPKHDEFALILDRTGGVDQPQIRPVTDGETVLRMGQMVRQVPIAADVQDHLIRLVRATHPSDANATERIRRYVRYGASPRAAQAMLGAARARALLHTRYHVAVEDVDAVAAATMRHRIILSFEGEAEGITTDELIADIIKGVRPAC